MGEEIHVDFNTGSSGGSGAGGSTGGEGGPRPRVSGGASGADFDYTQLVPSFVQTAREIVLNLVGFFRGIRRQGDFLNPLVFAIICAVVSGLLAGIIGLLISLQRATALGVRSVVCSVRSSSPPLPQPSVCLSGRRSTTCSSCLSSGPRMPGMKAPSGLWHTRRYSSSR